MLFADASVAELGVAHEELRDLGSPWLARAPDPSREALERLR